MSAELKYTDRDVRENSEFYYASVVDYLEGYQGEFSYLIDCKMRLAAGMDLSIGMVRGVLNCMRVDPRAPRLPEPKGYDNAPAEVVPMRQQKIKKQRRIPCDIEEFHGKHGGWGAPTIEDPYEYCHGKFAINRVGPYRRDLTVKVELAIPRSLSAMIHRVDLNSDQHYVLWYPHAHSWGWICAPELFIYTVCRYPRNIKNPILLAHTDLAELADIEGQDRRYCERCF